MPDTATATSTPDLNADFRDTESARRLFKEGQDAEQSGDRLAAIDKFEAAYAADPEDLQVCFRLAYNLDLVGEEDEAIHLYEECIRQEHPPLHALLNLAVLYEDRGKLAQAERCVRQVLTTNPNHARARLFIKDIVASKAMPIDEEIEEIDLQHSTLLDTPVTDFDLGVRTRNGLRKINIRTLGDLLKVTEAELRSYKNFGEASLEEIKAMLAQKGLRLGQAIEQRNAQVKQQVFDQAREQTGDVDVVDRSINELDMSVRARKALALLNVQSLGDLMMKTEAELMGVKNFGMTSLLEIKEKLAEIGLALRTLEE